MTNDKHSRPQQRITWLPPGPVERQLALGLAEDEVPIDKTNQGLHAGCCRCHGMCCETTKAVTKTMAGTFTPKTAPRPGEWLYAGHAGEGERHGQSYAQYIRGKRGERRRNFPSEKSRNTIYLCNLDSLGDGRIPDEAITSAMEYLRSFVEAFFCLPCKLLPSLSISERSRVIEREDPLPQYLTDPIHSLLRRRKGKLKDAFAVIGVLLSSDLYPERSWNFVFGEANADKGVGVVSFARYHHDFSKRWEAMFENALKDDAGGELTGVSRTDGGKDESTIPDRGESAESFLPPPEVAPLFWRRALKLLGHELGHLFHMEHCVYYQCIMNGAQTLEELDHSPLHFCPVCLRKLYYAVLIKGKQVSFDVLQRYQSIASFLNEDIPVLSRAAKKGFSEECAWVNGAIDQCALFASKSCAASSDPLRVITLCLCSSQGSTTDAVPAPGCDEVTSQQQPRTTEEDHRKRDGNPYAALYVEEGSESE